jgi:ribosomal-protein-alanine N-acetyltransferase
MDVRWLVQRDIEQVEAIEAESFPWPWSHNDFIRCLRQRNVIGLVARDDNDSVLGYVIYELHKHYFEILNLAVHPDHRRRGVGSTLINRLAMKLAEQRRVALWFNLWERNDEGHLFLRALGFKAKHVMRRFYEDDNDDAYRFGYRIQQPTLTSTEF